jgi:class 3 adenylate cyclase
VTAAAPSGVVTFLFTDIEGSTRRWETDADGMRAALLAHDKVLRTAIEAYDGFLFSHTGDGVVAAFASPMSAVNAAIDAQRELQLPVRMGIATGEAELREGDYFGTVLNRAARVMAAGHGGQILVADSTAVLVSGVDLVDGAATAAGRADPVGGLSSPSTRTRGRVSAVACAGHEPGQLAACGDQLHRPRVRDRRVDRGAPSTSVGDVDWCGRGRQDPTGHRGRGGPGR